MSRSERETKTKLSWQKKLLFASVTTFTFFLLLEGVLALFGVEGLTETTDPFVGFSSQVPLMERTTDEAGEAMLVTSPGKLIWFNPQELAVGKPEGTRRVFCMGGSTTYGRPFWDGTSFCGWLRELLPIVEPSAQWEVINAGGVSYASYRVTAVMEEMAQYEPDLFIVYTGQNEFLERRTYAGMFEQSEWSREMQALLQSTRTSSLMHGLIEKARGRDDSKELMPAEVDEILNHSVGPASYYRDDAWQAGVVQHFEWNLNRMVQIARRAGAEIVFVTPASNLRDCWPFKSQSSLQEGSDQQVELLDRLEIANLQLEDGNEAAALETCEAVLAVDDRYADAHFLAGRALLRMKRYAEAERAFRRAIDEDVCPLRATTTIVDTVRNVARDRDVPLVDFENRIRRECEQEFGHACVGGEYFLDHVHPTIDLHGDLALWIIETLQQSSVIGGDAPTASELALVKDRIESKIDLQSQAVAFRNLAKVLHWAGKFHEAIPRARDALRLIPDDQESRLILADSLVNIGRSKKARAVYERLFELGDYPRAYLPFGQLLAELGEFETAQSYLMRSILSDNVDHQARSYYLLGLIHLELEDYEAAEASFRDAHRIEPDDLDTLLWLSEVLLLQGRREEARTTVAKALALSPDHEAVTELMKRIEEEKSTAD